MNSLGTLFVGISTALFPFISMSAVSAIDCPIVSVADTIMLVFPSYACFGVIISESLLMFLF